MKDEFASEQGGELPSDHPANYVLMMCVSMSDPGMLVLPTHRLFRGIPSMTADELAAKLGDCFTTEPIANGPKHAPQVWEQVELDGEQGTLAFFTASDQQWVLARVTDAGRKKMAEVAAEHSAEWQGLGVSLLHRLVMDNLLGAKNAPAPKYVRSIDEVVHGLIHGDDVGRDLTGQLASGGRFELAARHAGDHRPHPGHLQPRRTDAGQKHLFLSEGAERARYQPAGVVSYDGLLARRADRKVPAVDCFT